MRYLLDTCTISDIIKSDQNTIERLLSASPTEIAVSTICVMELQYGLLHNPERAKKIKQGIKDFLKSVAIIPYTEEDAYESAAVRSFLKDHGSPIGSYDILIAGVALNNNLILVTSNENEFKRVPKLKIENWRL